MRGRIRTITVVAAAVVVVAGGLVTAVTAGAAAGAPVLLSKGKPVKASSNGTCCPAKNVNDGSTSTRWASAANKDPSWIYVDLGGTATISRVRLTWDKSCAIVYRVQTSADHTTWKSIFSTTTGNGGVDDLTVSGSGRYVRVFGSKRCRADATHGYSLDEFEVFGTSGSGDKTPPTAPGKPVVDGVTSSSVTVHYTAATDNVAVTEYDVLANGAVAGTVSGKTLTATASGLSPDTDYSITVVARDAAGNTSTPSGATSAHTSKGTGGGNPFKDPHLVSMFDGTSLANWTSSQSNLWVAKGGAIHGNGLARGWLYYNTHVGTFRWIFNVRQLPNDPGTSGHAPTVLIWGTNSPLRDALSAIQFQPPNGGHWDYRPGKNTGGGSEFKTFTHTKIPTNNWAQCELIGNMSTGVARMACCPLSNASNTTTCKGVEVLDFHDQTAGRLGLVALQVHNRGLHDEYKNLWIESPVVQSPGQFITT
jgi:FlaG/FlaF family flagellin (archaellin)